MRVGIRTVNDALVNLGNYRKVNKNYGNKEFVMRAIYNHDSKTLIDISNYFYESSGIYQRLCKYLATLYRLDWYVVPYSIDLSKDQQDSKKLLKDFSKVLLYLDQSQIKRVFSNITLDIIKEGVFYGIIVDFGNKFAIQKLPAQYCRVRFYSGPDPVVELNLRFFDAYFPNVQQKMKVLKTFPKYIQEAYVKYKQGKLKGDYPGDTTCWVALDSAAIRLSLDDGTGSGDGLPMLASVIPSIIDLDSAQELDRQKTMQQLLKIIVQKLPLDKNGDLIFDVDEARDIHNNAVAMLKRAVGVDVLTTFADIEKIDTKDNSSTTSTDDLEKVERTVYNNAGISHNIFNAEGNLAVTNAILADEASMRIIPELYSTVLSRIVEKFNSKNKYWFRVQVCETTQFNYKELSKMYKEQTSLGFDKFLPAIALGQPQSAILASLTFENDILHMAERMIPPMSSNVMSARSLTTQGKSNSSDNNNSQNSQNEAGRPKKDQQDLSDKSIANREAEG